LPAEAARWSGLGVVPDGGKTKALGTASRRRRGLPGDALIELEVGLGLLEKVRVRHRLGRLVPGGWLSCAEAGQRQHRLVRHRDALLCHAEGALGAGAENEYALDDWRHPPYATHPMRELCGLARTVSMR